MIIKKKPDMHILTVWRIRLLFAALVPSFLSAYFSVYMNWIWWLLTITWAVAFLVMYIFYYPIKYRKLSYSLNESCLVIHCGVIYTRVKAIPFSGIQYVSVSSTPLQRFFGVCTVWIYSAGSTAYIPGLLPSSASALQNLLAPTEQDRGNPIA